ncbi:MAG: amidohydrolase [Anaerolineales bacterium]|nr:amidohydrolase [Anaerolineales bacterium]
MGNQTRMDILIKDCQIVTMDEEHTVIDRGDIGIKGEDIHFIGPAGEKPEMREAERIIDGRGKVAVPGLINAHGHLAMTLFRGFVEDLKLQKWLERVWEYELTVLNEESVRIGSKIAMAEMIQGGVTTAHDMYWHYRATMDLAESIGFRLITGSPITEVGGDSLEELISEARDTLDLIEDYRTVHPVLQAHSIYTTSPEIMNAVRELKEEYGVTFTTHASENDKEVEEVQQKFGVSPIRQLEKFQLLDERSVLAHCVQVTEEDLEILQNHGVHVAHCPESNLKLGSGIAPVAAMTELGINVCLGTDGAASNNDLDMISEMRLIPLLQKGVNQDPRLIPTAKVLEMATTAGARAYGLEDQIGSLEEGKKADLVLLDFDRIHLKPCHDVYANLVYSANKFDVDTVLIAGRVQLEGGKLTTIDREELLEEAAAVSGMFDAREE